MFTAYKRYKLKKRIRANLQKLAIYNLLLISGSVPDIEGADFPKLIEDQKIALKIVERANSAYINDVYRKIFKR